jgi:hypothetical protein
VCVATQALDLRMSEVVCLVVVSCHHKMLAKILRTLIPRVLVLSLLPRQTRMAHRTTPHNPSIPRDKPRNNSYNIHIHIHNNSSYNNRSNNNNNNCNKVVLVGFQILLNRSLMRGQRLLSNAGQRRWSVGVVCNSNKRRGARRQRRMQV